MTTTGLPFYRFDWNVLLALLLIGLTGIVPIQNRPLALKALSSGGSAAGLAGGPSAANSSILALTHVLITPSSTIGDTATLLILFHARWFGLLIGAGAVLLLRFTQHVDISVVQGIGREGKQPGTDIILPMNERSIDYDAASMAHTGENVV